MRISMGLVQNKYGVYHERKKVPKALEEAVALVTGSSKPRVVWLKKTLRTKNLKTAKVRAAPIMMEFDRILAEAEALITERPFRTDLSEKEIERIAQYHYAAVLAEDEEIRRDGTGSEPLFQSIAHQLIDAGIEFDTPFHIGSTPEYGLSDREMQKRAEDLNAYTGMAENALARGDVSVIREQMDALQRVFRINLDPKSIAYRKLGMAILREDVNAFRAIERRQKGEPIETPAVPSVDYETASGGETIRAAFEGWKKSKAPSPTTLREFTYAINRFIEFGGDMPIQKITRKSVREFREALQQIPIRRVGTLRRAPLPELVEWSRKHSEAQKVAPATVNKVLGGVQAVAVWARDNGFIPDDVPWADPFSNMRLEEPEPEREPWEPAELRKLFSSPVFTGDARPAAGGGDAAYWLPLLGIFTGARLGELAPLTVADVVTDEATGITAITFTEDLEKGRRLKTRGSRRVVPIHPELVRLGFIKFVDKVKLSNGSNAQLFPLLKPGPLGGFGEGWSKWFGRYIRDLGITNKARVFHSFRHGFKDALRAAGISEDINDALTGHAGGGSVGRTYGAKDMVRRFGLPALADAVSKVSYAGLDFSHIHPHF
jgi:integrase